jgi:hypothetical protein
VARPSVYSWPAALRRDLWRLILAVTVDTIFLASIVYLFVGYVARQRRRRRRMKSDVPGVTLSMIHREEAEMRRQVITISVLSAFLCAVSSESWALPKISNGSAYCMCTCHVDGLPDLVQNNPWSQSAGACTAQNGGRCSNQMQPGKYKDCVAYVRLQGPQGPGPGLGGVVPPANPPAGVLPNPR